MAAEQRDVIAVLRRTMREQLERWRKEKQSIDKRIRDTADLQARSDKLALRITEIQRRLAELDLEVIV